MFHSDRRAGQYFINSESGFSLVEMIVAMGLFMIIMLITSNAFNRLIIASGSLMKSAESNIEGVVGLESLRKDVAQAGYGLPWTVQGRYSSAVDMPVTTPVLKSYTSLNDAPLGSPRAIGSLDNKGYNGSDYLAIKSTVAGMSNATRKSAIIRMDGITQSEPTNPFKGSDAVSVVRPVFSSAGKLTDKLLIGRGTYANVSTAVSTFRPDNMNDTYIAYGLDNQNMRAPFNRADYFIYRPTDAKSMPEVCAKIDDAGKQANTGIGILYKAVMNQNGGSYTLYPILDCVLDLQVVYGLDTTDPEGIDLHTGTALTSAADIRAQVKEVRVYILAQDGRLDRSYTYPNSSVYVGEFNSGRLFDFTTANILNWQNYRWKIYTIVVRTSL